jgi:NAD(P)-dependent dehydrogenase (short-subunit alcohol dehydrogenase family)
VTTDARPLSGKVCIVAGASRGVGRGVAVALGEAGAVVICSARSTRFGARTEGRRETVEDAAEAVEEAGGRGYPYVCDHTDPRALYEFAAYVTRRFGPPALVACSVWGGAEGFDGARYADGAAFGTPFYERSLGGYEVAIQTGAYALLATARAFAPVMIPARRGLIVALGFDVGEGSAGDVYYDLGKAATLRASAAMAAELAPHGLACLHLSPGYVRTERTVSAGLAAQATETPLYAGRAVAALAADPDVARHNARSLFVADLARAYGFTDADGTRPPRYAPPGATAPLRSR